MTVDPTGQNQNVRHSMVPTNTIVTSIIHPTSHSVSQPPAPRDVSNRSGVLQRIEVVGQLLDINPPGSTAGPETGKRPVIQLVILCNNKKKLLASFNNHEEACIML